MLPLTLAALLALSLVGNLTARRPLVVVDHRTVRMTYRSAARPILPQIGTEGPKVRYSPPATVTVLAPGEPGFADEALSMGIPPKELAFLRRSALQVQDELDKGRLRP